MVLSSHIANQQKLLRAKHEWSSSLLFWDTPEKGKVSSTIITEVKEDYSGRHLIAHNYFSWLA